MKKKIRTRLLTNTYSSGEISNSHLKEIKLVDTILVIKNVMRKKVQKEINLNYFQKNLIINYQYYYLLFYCHLFYHLQFYYYLSSSLLSSFI